MSKDFPTRPYVDGKGTEWQHVRCAGCGRSIGFTSTDGLRRAVYCSPWCVWEYEIRETPARRVTRLSSREATNDMWYWLFQTGTSVARLASMFGISNDFRVFKAIKSRREDDGSRLTKKRKAVTKVRKRRLSE